MKEIIKSYTDIEQSKKLAEILPLESADMCFNISQRYNMPPLMTPYSKFNEFFNMEKTPDFLIPCWSLAALLDILPQSIKFKGDNYYLRFMKEYVEYANDEVSITGRCLHTTGNNNLVDACVEMILKLKEENLL